MIDGKEAPKESIWSLEFCVCIAIVASGLFYLIPAYLFPEIERACDEYGRDCTKYLRPGWFMGQRMDVSDHQWNSFRNTMPSFIMLAVVWCILSNIHLITRAKNALQTKLIMGMIMTMMVNYVIFGPGLLWIILLCSGSYLVGSFLGSHKLLPAATWFYNLFILFLIHHRHELFQFSAISPSLQFIDHLPSRIRWYIMFNMLILRLISFNMDRFWALKESRSKGALGESGDGSPVTQFGPLSLSDRKDYTDFEQKHLPICKSSSYVFFLLYILYPPLMIAGPTITANAFISQFHLTKHRHSSGSLFKYGLRALCIYFLLEILLHYGYLFAIAKSGAWVSVDFEPLTILLFAYTAVHYIWLKFLIIWRFFRLWSLVDNIEVVENMRSCIDLAYTLRGFWSTWHRSFNRWLIRYIHVPLGGKNNYIISVLCVFTFTAMWHDLDLTLLLWGWLMVIVVVPEAFVMSLFARPSLAWLSTRPYFRFIKAFGLSLDAMFLISINLVGFAIGQGVGDNLIVAFYSWNGLYYLFWTVVYLISGYLAILRIERFYPQIKKKSPKKSSHTVASNVNGDGTTQV